MRAPRKMAEALEGQGGWRGKQDTAWEVARRVRDAVKRNSKPQPPAHSQARRSAASGQPNPKSAFHSKLMSPKTTLCGRA